MAKYPVEHTDDDGVVDAVNYLLSGPAGLGQNFKGYSTYSPADLTGNFRPPFTIAAPTDVAYANLYVAPIALSTSERLDGFTWKFNFASTIAPPFTLGQGPLVSGVTTAVDTVVLDDPDATTIVSGTKAASALPVNYTNVATTVLTGSGSGLVLTVQVGDSVLPEPYTTFNTGVLATATGTGWAVGDTVKVLGTALGGTTPANDLVLSIAAVTNDYNGDYSGVGVVECTTDYVIIRTGKSYPDPGTGTGGTISLSSMGFDMSTDCNAKVTVQGAGERVFVSAQLATVIHYLSSLTTTLSFRVRINRYVGAITSDPINPEYRFSKDATIAEKTIKFVDLDPMLTETSEVDAIFTSFIDQPPSGFYWYILEVEFSSDPEPLEVTYARFGLRTLTVQVVKQ